MGEGAAHTPAKRRAAVVGPLVLGPMALGGGLLAARWDPLYEPPAVYEGSVCMGPRADGGVRVLTLNLAHGRGTAFHQALTRPAHVRRNLQAVASLIRAADVDVVALQELDAPSTWSGGFDHLDYLAEQLGWAHTYHGLHVTRRFPRLNYGTGIVSRFPIRGGRTRPFDLNALDTKGFVYAVVDAPQMELGVVSVHLDFKRDAERRAQLDLLSMFLAAERDADHLVVAGDFNCGLGDTRGTLRTFVDRHDLFAPAEDVPTFPSRRPARSLDHVFVSRSLSVQRRSPLDVLVSDHLPLLVEVVSGGRSEELR